MRIRIAKSIKRWPNGVTQFRNSAIPQLLVLLSLILLVVPVAAQTSTAKAPSKVTVTLVRWPYT